MYLESIFSAPDIQRQLPGPTKAFQTIDKEFRSIMRAVKDRPLVLTVRLWLTLSMVATSTSSQPIHAFNIGFIAS
jgi:hypothetical protein